MRKQNLRLQTSSGSQGETKHTDIEVTTVLPLRTTPEAAPSKASTPHAARLQGHTARENKKGSRAERHARGNLDKLARGDRKTVRRMNGGGGEKIQGERRK